jgi:solute carrier family 34 (sodium-dependent phosphate cotransporter)
MADTTDSKQFMWLPRIVLFVLMLYVFLGSIKLLEVAFGVCGSGAVDQLFQGLSNPFAGLAVGILATALVQSSSATTSMVVVLVGAGELSLASAVPVVMGANIGTSVTCVMVSLGHVTRDAPFRRAFAGATVHDLFNLLTVAILLPLELATGMLRHSATFLVTTLFGDPQAGSSQVFKSPIKTVVTQFASTVRSVFEDGLGLHGTWLGVLLGITAVILMVLALLIITKNMRLLMADHIEEWLNRVLKRSGLLGMLIGTLITMAVQSSSITTSLLIPMFGAGVLQLEAGFPIMLGANIGTTITAILAALVIGPTALTIAVVHLLFNLLGTAIFFPFKSTRRIPIMAAEKLADLVVSNRVWVAVYVFGVFFLIPAVGIFFWR